MRLKIVSAVLAAAALVPSVSLAEGLSYSYLDVAYINTDIDRFDEDVDGFALRGSFEVADQVFIRAGYADQSTTVFGFDIDLQSFNVGIGYAWPIASATDLYGVVGYTSVEADAGGGSVDDDGYELVVGVRSRVADSFELEGSVNYVDLSDSGDDTSLGLGARWYFTDAFAVGVEGAFGDDASTYGVGLRWNFGN